MWTTHPMGPGAQPAWAQGRLLLKGHRPRRVLAKGLRLGYPAERSTARWRMDATIKAGVLLMAAGAHNMGIIRQLSR